METEIKRAIKLLTEKITTDTTADEALQFTQAALNLAHTHAVIKNPGGSSLFGQVEQEEKPGKKFSAKVGDILSGDDKCPFPMYIIQNQTGIPVGSVSHVSWRKMDDGKFVDLTIHFLPA